MLFICLFCYQLFMQINNSVICLQCYQFDVVKEGYINLLLVQYKCLCDLGDSVEMMQVRRVFFDVGYYQLLCDVVINLLCEWLDQLVMVILDIGCGEGYYIYVFVEVLLGVIMFGLDVVKMVIKVVVKCYLQVKFCVVLSY